MLNPSLVVAVELPHPVSSPLDAEVEVVAWSHTVAALNRRVRSDRGDWSASEAHRIGAAMMSGALAAGHAVDRRAGHHVVALPAPVTPLWGDPGHVYFMADDTYVAVELSRGTPGAAWVGDDLVPAEVAWSEGLAIVAAARLVADRELVA